MKSGVLYGIIFGWLFCACQSVDSTNEQELINASRYVLDEDGRYLLAISNGNKEIYLQNDILIWKDIEEGRLYYNKEGKQLFEIKYLESGFEIYNSEHLILKIRTDYEDKVKISRNIEMIHDWELKRKDDRIDIEFSNSNLAEIKWNALETNELVFDQYRFFGFKNSLAPGVWAFLDDERPEAAVLINEIVRNENMLN